MVRFARAAGSKGSNKRVFEESTPWGEMVQQMKKQETTSDNAEKDNANDNAEKDNANDNVEKDNANDNAEKDNANDNAEKDNTSDNAEKDNANDNAEKDNADIKDQTNESDHTKKKKKKKKKKNAEVPAINPNRKDMKLVVENNQRFQVLENGKKRPWFDLPYEESDRMTRFEGFWMKPAMAVKMNQLKEDLKATLDANSVRKKMMKAKRKAHKELTQELIVEQKRLVRAENNNLPKEQKQKVVDDTEKKWKDEDGKVEGVLFGGFWVSKEGADRLKKLQADLVRNSVPKIQQKAIMKSERRKEEKALRRENKRVCLRCRKRGHMVNECPEDVDNFGMEQTNNAICYACGSTEHRIHECSHAASKNGEFPHATCFVCKRVGHISRQCPDNPRGLYPNGGSCRGCGSVEHLAANCSVLLVEQEQTSMRLGRIDGNAVESLDIELPSTSEPMKVSKYKKQSVKVIKF